MTRLKRSGFAGSIAGVVSGATDCAAASAARANDSNATGIKVRLSMIRIGAKAASFYSDWIRPGTQLLYTAMAPKYSGGCQRVNGSLSPRDGYGFGLSTGFCCCCASAVHGGTIPFMRASVLG